MAGKTDSRAPQLAVFRRRVGEFDRPRGEGWKGVERRGPKGRRRVAPAGVGAAWARKAQVSLYSVLFCGYLRRGGCASKASEG